MIDLVYQCELSYDNASIELILNKRNKLHSMAITLTSKAAFADETFQIKLAHCFGSKHCVGFTIDWMETGSNVILEISSSSQIIRPKNRPKRNVIA